MGLVGSWMVLALGAVAVPLAGTVVDTGGEPVGGVSLWLAAPADHYPDAPEVLALAETDARGRFSLDWLAEPEKDDRRGPPTLWAYKRGAKIGVKVLSARPTGGDGPVRLTVGPSTETAVRVYGVNGKAVTGARVRLFQIHGPAGLPPAVLADRLEAKSDETGRAVLDGVRAEDVAAVVVTADGAGSQSHSFFPPGPGERTVRLLPVGRFEGRIVADDPEGARGWVVTLSTRPESPGFRGSDVSRARARSDARGRFAFDAIAEGRYTLAVEPPDGSLYRAARPDMGVVRGGETTEVEVKAQRGIKVEGIVREQGVGKPIAGVGINVTNFTSGGASQYPVTDREGRYSCLMMPGKIVVNILNAPRTHCQDPVSAKIEQFELTEGQRPITLPPIELQRAGWVRGVVVDQDGKPVAAAVVKGVWSEPRFRQGASGYAVQTDASGAFGLGGIVPGTRVELTAALGKPPMMETPVGVMAKAEESDDRSVTLQLRRVATVALRGRVLGPGGRPLAGASVRVQLKAAGGLPPRPVDFVFAGGAAVRSGPDGTFRTPNEVPAGHEYRVRIDAPGAEPSESGWVKSPGVELPDVLLRSATRLRVVVGRVLDRAGAPVAGAEVIQSGDGPARTGDRTDDEGRFEVPGVYDAPAFVFIRKEGYRFTGRRVEAGDAPVEVVVSRSNASPPPVLETAAAAASREVEKTLAYELIAPARAKLIAGGGDAEERTRVLEVLALLDPGWVVDKIGREDLVANQALLSDVVLGYYLEDASGVVKALDTLRGPGAAVLLELDAWAACIPGADRRVLLNAALEFARQETKRSDRTALLARVADRWLDLGEPGRAAPILGEATALAATLPKRFDLHPHGILAEALARTDLAAALTLLERPGIAPYLDLRRAGVAVRAAANDPQSTERLLDLLTDKALREDARAAACARMAAKDLPRARELAAGSPDPGLGPVLFALAARARATVDPEGAKVLLALSFEQLGTLSDRVDPMSPTAPAVTMARLLPIAVRVDPARSSEFLWRTLAARTPRGEWSPTTEPAPGLAGARVSCRNVAVLAALVSRYDRSAASVVFNPLVESFPLIFSRDTVHGDEAGAILAAAAAYDPRVAKALIDALPDDPTPSAASFRPRTRTKADLVLAVARSLALPASLRRYEPVGRFGNWDD